MTTVGFCNADVLVDGRFVAVDVVVEHGRIVGLPAREAHGAPGPVDEVVDLGGSLVAPGYVDLQCNGAARVDLTSEPHRIADVAAALPRFGITAFLPTVVTAPAEQRRAAIAALPAARATVGDDGASPLGLHFEGPLISPERLGAHPAAHVVHADGIGGELDEWIRSGCVALVTLAPELDGMTEVIRRLHDGGVVVAAGHTTMSPADLAVAVDAGVRYVTHLYNAMRPFSHRDPGSVGAALTADVVAGLICDGLHVDPVAVDLAWRVLGPTRTSLVSDAVAALGEPSGTLRLGGLEVHHDESGVRTADGTLAGSSLPLDRGVRNLVAFTGCTLADAIATVTSTPADLLGLTDRGRIAVGARADLVVLDGDGQLRSTWIAGRCVHDAG
jgi:N-acetylglucosamine-6-phosphate deacetylase